MSKGNKLQRFAELNTFSNVIQYPDHEESKPFPMRGKWAEEFFKNDHPIVLELACGKGEYTIGLAKQFPEKNFIGIDIKGNRIWKGAKYALENDMKNVGFLRIEIEKLPHYFADGEIDEIWITFPDPQLKKKRTRKRLTFPRFLKLYEQVGKKNVFIHLKTDSTELYEFTIEMIEQENCRIEENIKDVYKEAPDHPVLTGIKTYYEGKHLENGLTIKYLKFRLWE